jgi:hypothetical protein
MRVRVLGAAVAVAVLAGCTSVKLVQRDGCWVRQTKKLGAVKEDLGPCAPPAPAWSDDRLTRLVQECAVRADHRWRTLANAAFQRGTPMPGRTPEDEVHAQCVEEATRLAAAQGEAELASLREKLSDAEEERTRLRERAEREHAALAARVEKDHEAFVARDAKERDALAESTTKLADWLGQAASKPAQPAVATATASSDGRARTESDSEQRLPAAMPWLAPEAAPAEAVVSFRAEPAAPAVCAAPAEPERAPAVRRVRAARPAKLAARAAPAGCEIPTATASATPTPSATPAAPPAATPAAPPATAATGTGSAAAP